MKKLIVLLCLACSFVLYAAMKIDYVEVTLNHDDSTGEVTLVCVSKQTMENMPKRWVKICNEKGHAMLQRASEKGHAVKVTEKPFGKAGDFAEQMSKDLPINVTPTSITSVDLSIR